MNEDKIELQDDTASVTIQCPFCEDGGVRVDSPIALYVGRPVALTSSKVAVRYSAGIALGRCNKCQRPIPISPCAIVSREDHENIVSRRILNNKGGA